MFFLFVFLHYDTPCVKKRKKRMWRTTVAVFCRQVEFCKVETHLYPVFGDFSGFCQKNQKQPLVFLQYIYSQ